mgnify:CR=1 FL=1
MITVNQIYDRIVTALDGIYVTKYYTRITEQLPCVYVRESHAPIHAATNIDFSDDQCRMYFYIEVYGEQTEEIVATIEATMRGMGFLEELSEMIPNYDPSIERVSLRFQRVICGGDTLNE